MKKFGLNKRQKLCGEISIDQLFSRSAQNTNAAIAFPLRGVWRTGSQRRDEFSDIKILISIPKKRLRRAVDRVTMRRRVREAFRLNQHSYPTLHDRSIDLALVYIADKLLPYRDIERAINKLLFKIAQSLNESPSTETES